MFLRFLGCSPPHLECIDAFHITHASVGQGADRLEFYRKNGEVSILCYTVRIQEEYPRSDL